MHDPRESGQRTYDGRLDYAENSVDQHQVFIPKSHVRVVGDKQRAEVIQETYRLLAIGVFAAMASAWLASRSLGVISLMASPIGFLLAMVGLNIVPQMALKAARQSSRNAALLLAGHGAFAGICLSPLIFIAMMKSGLGTDTPNLVQAALVITAAVFLGISGYIYQSGTSFNYGKGLGVGLCWALLVAIPVNAFMLGSGALGTMILVGIGLLGTLQLLWATSTVLRDPEFNDPAVGALCLFAGLFNLFQVVLSLLSRR
jgi:FtsH-binding integral membrane protein